MFSVICIVIALCSVLSPSNSEIPLSQFFAFGTNNGDAVMQKVDDNSSPAIPISVTFPFADHRENLIYVNTNGDVSFGRGIREWVPTCGAGQIDDRMVAIFWADIDNRNFGDIFYRESVSPDDLRQAARDISTAYPNLVGINIKWLFIATWDNVAPYADVSGCLGNGNTFQLALATDGRLSFAIFYYNKITWPDINNRCGFQHAVKVGFDAGDGQNFIALPGSCTTDVNVLNASNTNMPGKWVFRIDTNITVSNCDNSSYVNGGQKLKVSPSFVGVLGGDLITVQGPCFDETADIVCIYHDIAKGPIRVNGQLIKSVNEADPQTVYCQTPFFHQSGRIQLEVVEEKTEDINGTTITTQLRTFEGLLTVALESPVVSVTMEATSTSPSTYATSRSNGIVSVKWPVDHPSVQHAETVDILLLVHEAPINEWIFVGIPLGNITNNGNVSIDIKRYLAKTRRTFDPDTMFLFTVSPSRFYDLNATAVLEQSSRNSGKNRFWPLIIADIAKDVVTGVVTDYVCYKQGTLSSACKTANFVSEHGKDTVSFAKCVLSNPSILVAAKCGLQQITSGFAVSQLLSLVTDFTKSAIYSGICAAWSSRAQPIPPTPPILDCPPLLTQAQADPSLTSFKTVAREYQQTWDPSLPSYQDVPLVGFRQAVPNSKGAGQTCMYAENGQLRKEYSYADAAAPTDWMSTYGNMYLDEVGEFACCQKGLAFFESMIGFNKVICMEDYVIKRPTNDGSNYVPPPVSQGKGDPHIATLDRFSYTFNGIGEFWMIKPVKNAGESFTLSMQARMEKFLGSGSTSTNASVFTSFAMQAEPRGTVVEVKLSQAEAVDVLVNGIRVQFDDDVLRRQSFKSVLIEAVKADLSEMSVIFNNGMTFRFTTAQGAMAVTSTAHRSNKNLFEGLMGNFDGDAENDLQKPDGSIMSPHSSLSDIHYNFGMKWIVSKDDSLFTYPSGRTYDDYYDPSFVPILEVADATPEAKEICGDSIDCLFDFVATGGDVAFANLTIQMEHTYNETVELFEQIVIMCDSFIIANGTASTETSYFDGAVVNVTCFGNFELVGTSQINCKNGIWVPEPPKCVSVRIPEETTLRPPNNDDSALIMAIAIPIAAVFVAALLGIMIGYLGRRSRRS